VTSLASMTLTRERSDKFARTLDAALRDLHSHCNKLVAFCALNSEALRKAQKKFVKRLGGTKAAKAAIQRVLGDSGDPLDARTAEALEARVRHIFAQYFAHGNIALATESLRARAADAPHWRVFSVVGTCLGLMALLAYDFFANREALATTPDAALVLTIVRITFAANLLVLLFAGVLGVFRV
jgi:hypothetical protein